MEAPSGTLTAGTNEQAVKATVRSLKKAPHVISAVSPLSSEGAGALSKDKRIGYISVTIDLSSSDLTEDQANEIIDAEAPARDAGFEVATGGYLGQAVSKPSTESSEAVGIAAAVIILLFTFGTVTAMALPIATAIVGLSVGLERDRAAGTRDRGAHGGPDVGHDAGARRRDRLRAVHRHPPPWLHRAGPSVRTRRRHAQWPRRVGPSCSRAARW